MNSDEIRLFASKWLGFGNTSNNFWILGPEPGGTADQLNLRIVAWQQLASTPLVDAARFHNLINEPRWFGDRNTPPMLQPTWKKVIAAFCAYKGFSSNDNTYLNAQTKLFGTENQNINGMNKIYLSALSSPRMSDWGYDFATRSEYEQEFLPKRIETLKRGFSVRKNSVILMIGTSRHELYEQIVGAKLEPETRDFGRFYVAEKDTNLWCLAKHPMAEQSLQYWIGIGNYIRGIE